ncbi:MAG: universal stress protein [Pseudomonadota bacterium]|nr:universal stress protein [Pseudomonadota bacterium]
MELLLSSAAHYGCHLATPRRSVKQGEAVAVLRDKVSNLRPDLLVLGTHGQVGLSYMLFGSVAEAILNQPSCDALVVRAW